MRMLLFLIPYLSSAGSPGCVTEFLKPRSNSEKTQIRVTGVCIAVAKISFQEGTLRVFLRSSIVKERLLTGGCLRGKGEISLRIIGTT